MVSSSAQYNPALNSQGTSHVNLTNYKIQHEIVSHYIISYCYLFLQMDHIFVSDEKPFDLKKKFVNLDHVYRLQFHKQKKWTSWVTEKNKIFGCYGRL